MGVSKREFFLSAGLVFASGRLAPSASASTCATQGKLEETISSRSARVKGYWIILGTAISDQLAQAEYNRLWKPIGERYQARINPEKAPVIKEAHDVGRVTVVEFPSYELALQCYDDAAYREAREFALKASNRTLLVIEGQLS